MEHSSVWLTVFWCCYVLIQLVLKDNDDALRVPQELSWKWKYNENTLADFSCACFSWLFVCVCDWQFSLSVPNHVFPELKISYLNTARLKPLTRSGMFWIQIQHRQLVFKHTHTRRLKGPEQQWVVLEFTREEVWIHSSCCSEVVWVLQRTLGSSVPHFHKFKACIITS